MNYIYSKKRGYFFLFLFLSILFFANEAFGVEIGSSVDIDAANFTVIYNEFINNAGTTNFSALSDTELEAISGMSLETNFGNIKWLQIVNLTEVHQNRIIDLDSRIDIVNRSMSLDGAYFTNLAKPANLSFYGIIFVQPQILINGDICQTPDCTVLSYNNGIFVFNTTLPFSDVTYVIQETSSPPGGGTDGTGGSSGGSGSTGGTGGGIPPGVNFTVSKDLIELRIGKGESKTETIEISNVGNVSLDFSLSVLGVSSYLSLSNNFFTLLAGETKSIAASFFIWADELPGVHTGKINVYANSLIKDINVILEIVDSPTLFDIVSELKDDTLTKNQNLESTISITDVGNVGNVDVLVEYFAKDFEENEIKLGEEIININGNYAVEKSFEVFNLLGFGEYAFYVKLNHNGNIVTSANYFKIVDVRPILVSGFILFLVIIIIVVSLAIIAWRSWEGNKYEGGVVVVKK